MSARGGARRHRFPSGDRVRGGLWFAAPLTKRRHAAARAHKIPVIREPLPCHAATRQSRSLINGERQGESGALTRGR
ncbi:hypothetical protein Prum_056870 [Phytohabitans rumicis]|uniref:Uncharacterized protein n=1 Tax=Phytohabitans rumicis TaxID=1076125 RepID=A0A6V8LHE1_9ACTN|nr:hypothetical protein Prum_056870 [Phytohabitans rumicis]